MTTTSQITQVFGQGSWLKETFVNPNPIFLNQHLKTVLTVIEKHNQHTRDEIKISDLYNAKYIQSIKTYIKSKSIIYKQYALIGFLESNAGFQDYVRKRQPTGTEQNVDIFLDFLHLNLPIYTSGLQFDGTKYSKPGTIKERRIYRFMNTVRQAAVGLCV